MMDKADRPRAKADALASDGAAIADTPAEAVRDAEIVVVMLENGPIVADVLFGQGAAEAMQVGTVVVDTSSIKPFETPDHAARLLAHEGDLDHFALLLEMERRNPAKAANG